MLLKHPHRRTKMLIKVEVMRCIMPRVFIVSALAQIGGAC